MSRNLLFNADDEAMFKKQFVIGFLANIGAEKWKEGDFTDSKYPVEDAQYLANKAWEDWKNIIGFE